MNPCIHHNTKEIWKGGEFGFVCFIFFHEQADHIQEFEAILYVYYPNFMVNIVVNLIFNINFMDSPPPIVFLNRLLESYGLIILQRLFF